MTIQECYENIGANYDEILGRIGKAERIEKFLKLFLKDDSYPGLCKAMEEMRNEAVKEERVEVARQLLELGKLSYEEIAKIAKMTIEEVKALDKKVIA